MLIESILQYFFSGMFIISLGLSFVLAFLALVEYRLSKRRDYGKNNNNIINPPITIIIPVYNEEKTIAKTIDALQNITYSDIEIIIVDDGSTDASLEILHKIIGLKKVSSDVPKKLKHQPIQQIFHSNDNTGITVISKMRGGKFDALNSGINFSSCAWFCCIDADTIIQPNALEIMMERIRKEPTIIGLAGQIRVGNNPTKNRFLVAAQSIEYIRSFMMERVGWSFLQGLVLVPGAFCLFNKKAVCEVGGYSDGMPTEDVELVLKLHNYQLRQNRKYRIEYVPEAIAFTDVPANVHNLAKQRERWYLGLWMSIYQHRDMFWKLRYKVIGLFVLPYLLIFELVWPILVATVFIILTTNIIVFHTAVPAILIAITAFAIQYLLTTIIVVFDQYFWRIRNHENIGSILWSTLLALSVFSYLLFLFKLQAFISFFKSSTARSGKWTTLRHTDVKISRTTNLVMLLSKMISSSKI